MDSPISNGSEVVAFYLVAPGAIAPVRADRAALGTLPFAAYQYCEALTAASAMGWYVFALEPITLRNTGSEVLYLREGRWQVLSTHTPAGVTSYWNAHCPPELIDRAPPFATALFVPGFVQLWTGLLIKTAPGWSTLVRPLVNLPPSSLYSVYEAIVETDTYGPWPLFTNLRLNTTEVDVEITNFKPLFQLQLVKRDSTSSAAQVSQVLSVEDLAKGSSAEAESGWNGYLKTVRPLDPLAQDRTIGQYAAAVRRRSKN